MNIIEQLEKEQVEKFSATKTIPDFGPGDTLKVSGRVTAISYFSVNGLKCG